MKVEYLKYLWGADGERDNNATAYFYKEKNRFNVQFFGNLFQNIPWSCGKGNKMISC